ncbi:MAG: hypothetical protein JRG92_11550 [Deltaproteobacteria bacterium]|nr:hypothetical protein [Deltaproteobacteria bacterium]
MMRRGLRAGAGAFSAAASRAACVALGAVRSSAHASRWRATGRWTSQQLTLQKWSAVRLRLQVETLQT